MSRIWGISSAALLVQTYLLSEPDLTSVVFHVVLSISPKYNRSRKDRTLYICGTNEYGTTTEIQASKEGLALRALCNKYNELHRELIRDSIFLVGRRRRSTKKFVKMYLQLYKNNMLEKQTKEQTYCETCSKFLAERFVKGTCLHCGYEGARDQCDVCSRTLDPGEPIKPRRQSNRVSGKVGNGWWSS